MKKTVAVGVIKNCAKKQPTTKKWLNLYEIYLS
jgi:hypothetical protein